MRSRNIKPGFFKNDELGECHPLARILFIGYWCMADREGRLEYRPKKIKAEVLPYDEPDEYFESTILAPYKHHASPVIAFLTNQLMNHGFIFLYSDSGKQYLQVVNFSSHQNPHCKEAESRIPKPPEITEENTAPYLHHTCTIQAPCENSESTEQALLIPDSLLLIPDSNINTASDDAAPKNDDGEFYLTKSGKRLSGEKLKSFEQFWEIFNWKKGKAEAAEEWRKLKIENGTLEQILMAAKIESEKRQELIKRGCTPKWAQGWLSGRRWEDEQLAEGGSCDKYNF